MDLATYRESKPELERTADLLRLIPSGGATALDVGARDGHFSKLLAGHFESVTALDLAKPSILHESIQCIQGDVTNLNLSDGSFDLVFCAEVLEHISSQALDRACAELSRVSKKHLLIGVPYKQDIRVGRTTCHACGKKNPPWGHVNTFDEKRLASLFPKCEICEVSFAGKTAERTNLVSALLMDWAGNPYGTYEQEEPCIYCNKRLSSPPERNVVSKVLTRLAVWGNAIQRPFVRAHGNWIHVLFRKVVP